MTRKLIDELRQTLRDRRVALGLSQVDVALRMDTTQSYVSDLEQGAIGIPSPNSLTRWAKALDLLMSIETKITLQEVRPTIFRVINDQD
jgi:transcriptional regulator with XRE-family HTH domain